VQELELSIRSQNYPGIILLRMGHVKK